MDTLRLLVSSFDPRRPLGLVGEYAFLPSGQILLTGEGRLLDTRTGEVIGRLPSRI